MSGRPQPQCQKVKLFSLFNYVPNFLVPSSDLTLLGSVPSENSAFDENPQLILLSAICLLSLLVSYVYVSGSLIVINYRVILMVGVRIQLMVHCSTRQQL